MTSSGSPASVRGAFACTTCGKQFERKDHLRRHLDSHKDKRVFKCFQCGKGYNRRDLLTRHYAIHEKPTGSGSVRAARAMKACQRCATSKLKCDDERPCKRCRLADRPCINPDASAVYEDESFQSHENTIPSLHHVRTATSNGPETSGNAMQRDEPLPEPQADLGDMYDGFDYPMYFEHIMMPELFPVNGSMEIMQPSLDLGDTHFFGQTLDTISDLDFGAIFDPSTLSSGPQPGDMHEANHTHTAIPDVPRTRLEAFKRSPWLWMPSAQQSAFDEQNQFLMDATSADLVASPNTPSAHDASLIDPLTFQERDSILLMVKSTCKDRVAISNFPSPEVLTTLASTCIAKRLRTDQYFHPSTFDCRSARTELLVALIAGGCVCFGIKSVSRTGLLLQEVVRMSLDRLFETDNRVVRDLQYLQAYMLWVDIGGTCGIKRKMEIAESRFQPLCTALRRAGAFESAKYVEIVPSSSDEGQELRQKWEAWAEQESLKRLAYYAQDYDAKLALLFNRPPLISYAEVTAPLPCSLELWLARSAAEWKTIYTRLYDAGDTRVALRHVLTNPQVTWSLSQLIDASRARTLRMAGLAGQVWELKQQTLTLISDDPNATLWSRSRRSELVKRIDDVYAYHQESSPAPQLFQQYLLMSLYVEIDDLHRFAGRNGDNEARQAYQKLEPWSQDKSGRCAVWHAGQVLRAARLVAPYQFRGLDSIEIYHATLVLWVYGVLRGAEGRHTGRGEHGQSRGPAGSSENSVRTTPSPSGPASIRNNKDSVLVYLDGDEVSDLLVWRELGRGRPGISAPVAQTIQHVQNAFTMAEQETTVFCDLRKSNLVMETGSSILERNYPDVVSQTPGSLPPLVESLRDLMRELGRLPGHSETNG